MNRSLLLLLAVALCAVSATVSTWKRTNTNITRPTCPRIVALQRGVSSVRRDQAILCGFSAVDTDRNGLINATEYGNFVRSMGRLADTLAPSFSDICADCDCSGDQQISTEEAKHASLSCLETNLKINLVYDNVCPE